jgi:hypothetical protein
MILYDHTDNIEFIRVRTKQGPYIDYIAKGTFENFCRYVEECRASGRAIKLTNPFSKYQFCWKIRPEDILGVDQVNEHQFACTSEDIGMLTEKMQYCNLMEKMKADLEESAEAMLKMGEYQKKMLESIKN